MIQSYEGRLIVSLTSYIVFRARELCPVSKGPPNEQRPRPCPLASKTLREQEIRSTGPPATHFEEIKAYNPPVTAGDSGSQT